MSDIGRGRATLVTELWKSQVISAQREVEDFEPAWQVLLADDGFLVGFGTVNGVEAEIGGKRIGGYNPDGTKFRRPRLPASGGIIGAHIIVEVGDDPNFANKKPEVKFWSQPLTSYQYPLALMVEKKRFIQLSYNHLRYNPVVVRGGKIEAMIKPIGDLSGWVITETT